MLQLFSRQNALSAAATWLRGNPRGKQFCQLRLTSWDLCWWTCPDTIVVGTCLLEVRGCSARGEVPWRQQDRFGNAMMIYDAMRWFDHGRPNLYCHLVSIHNGKTPHLSFDICIFNICNIDWCTIFHYQCIDSRTRKKQCWADLLRSRWLKHVARRLWPFSPSNCGSNLWSFMF